jgi:microcompartment protein CcmL/EutN
MKKPSLGLIETWGYVPAVEAADAGTKAADVTFLDYEITKVALVTVKFTGEVSAVQAAVAAGAAAAKKVGKVVSVHVIPRPDPQIPIEPLHKLPPPAQPPKDEEPEVKPEPPTLKKEEIKVKPDLPPPPKGKEKKSKRAKPIKKSRKTK